MCAPPGLNNWNRQAGLRGLVATCAGLLAVLAGSGCGGRDGVTVQLQSRGLPQEPTTLLRIDAQIRGPTDGLHFKWFAVSGECEPQESDDPKTVFRFLEGARRDKVTVEVWRDQKEIAESQLDVQYDTERARREQHHPADVQIDITNIPPAEPGGTDTHADISGTVTGKVPPNYMVVIYARAAGAWYVQPQSGAVLPLEADKSWKTWTHTGTRYAALLVRREFEPFTRLDMLPETNDYVLAIDIVNGRLKSATDTTASDVVHSK